MTKIAVLGATGMIGSVITKELAAAGRDLTTISRNAADARSKLPGGVTAMTGDVSRPETLGPVGSADIVLFMLSVDPKTAKPSAFNPDRDGLANVIKVAKNGRRPHIVYLASQLEQTTPHDWWVLKAKAEASALLKASGLNHTILRPSNVMESLPGRMQRGKSVGWIGTPKQTSRWIAGVDLARMLNTHLDRPLDQSYDLVLQGPEALTVRDAAERFAASRGLKASGAPMPVLSFIANFSREIRYAVGISKAMNDAPESDGGQAVWDVLGRPMTTVEDFAGAIKA